MITALLALNLLCAAAEPAETAEAPETKVYVRTVPSGATIRLDGKSSGSSDDLFDVKPGDHRIVAELENYQRQEQQVQVREGRITRVNLTLKPCADAQNIVKNPGVEAGEKTPDGWRQGAAIPGVKYSWERKAGSTDKGSLCIEKTVPRHFPIAQWSQTVDRQGDQSALAVSAQVKAKNMTKAILDVVFLDEQGNWISHEWAAYIGSKAEGDPPANHDWKEYSGKVKIPPQTKKISLGLQVYGPGKVWFDDLRAAYTK